MANKHIKRCSTSHIIREMKIKTTMRYHLMAVRMAAIKKSTNNKTWRGCAEKENLLHCWLECKLVQPLWITVWRFIKKKKKKTGTRTAISSVQSLSRVQLFATPWTAACQASLSITNFWTLPRLLHPFGDTIQPSHPLSSPSPAFNLSQHQGLFQ